MNCFLRKSLGWLVFAVALGGCGTTAPTNYYLLNAKPGPPSGDQSPSLGIGPIEIPEYLNRNGLVYNSNGNQLQIANYERWAEPLSSGIERVLGLNLANLLDTGNLRFYPWSRTDEPDYSVEVTVLLMEANASQATLIAEWLVRKSGREDVMSRKISQLQHTMPAGPVAPQNIAPAYSALLLQLSEEIAGVVAQNQAD